MFKIYPFILKRVEFSKYQPAREGVIYLKYIF